MEPFSLTSLNTLVDAGGIGLAIIVLFYTAWKDKLYNKTLNNHLDHIHKAIVDNALSSQNLSNAISKLDVGLSANFDRTNRILNRVEDTLDK